MFSKLFSCLSDSTSQEQVDLSRQHSSNGGANSQGIQNKPQLPQESNIQGQHINFEMDDLHSNNLLSMHFLQQANIHKTQKYYYEQDDGEVESKITTASPSKTQHYQQVVSHKEELLLPPNLILENQNNLLPHGSELRNDQDPSPIMKFSLNPQNVTLNQQQVSLTEKKLNNYLQQAKYLMNSQNTNNNGIGSQPSSIFQSQIPQTQQQQLQQNAYIPYQNQSDLRQTIGSHRKSKGSAQTQVMRNYSYDTEVYSGSNSVFMQQQHNHNHLMTTQNHHQQLPTHIQNIYSLDSCPSSKVLFNALDDLQADQINTDQNLKTSFSAQKQKGSTQKRLQKLEQQKKSYSDSKKSTVLLTKQQTTGSGIGSGVSRLSGFSHSKQQSRGNITGQNNPAQVKKDLFSHRNSDASSRISGHNVKSAINKASSKQQQKTAVPHQIIDQFDNIIIEENNQLDGEDNEDYQQQSYDGQLRVLDYDDDGSGQIQQIDLGKLQGYNKRQTSKTEVFSPLTYSSHRKNKVSAIPSSSAQKPLKTKQSSTGLHKKTSSHMQTLQDKQQNQTRNNGLNKKHMTTTTSPAMERTPDQQLRLSKQISLTTGKKANTRPSQIISPNKRTLGSHNTLEIQEDQNEEEDNRFEIQSHKSATGKFQLQQREFDIINQTISPSSQSSFQFQPKFFKPTTSNNGASIVLSQNSQSKISMTLGYNGEGDSSSTLQIGQLNNNLQNLVLNRKNSQQQI